MNDYLLSLAKIRQDELLNEAATRRSASRSNGRRERAAAPSGLRQRLPNLHVPGFAR